MMYLCTQKNTMAGLNIINNAHQLIITIDKQQYTPIFIDRLIKRLELELILSKSEAQEADLTQLANDIKAEWWEKNKDSYMKGVDGWQK
jgi:hypothetical protein